jgi:hypothetical protein
MQRTASPAWEANPGDLPSCLFSPLEIVPSNTTAAAKDLNIPRDADLISLGYINTTWKRNLSTVASPEGLCISVGSALPTGGKAICRFARSSRESLGQKWAIRQGIDMQEVVRAPRFFVAEVPRPRGRRLGRPCGMLFTDCQISLHPGSFPGLGAGEATREWRAP